MRNKLFFILLFLPSILFSQTIWYVSPSGSDLGAGTYSEPWRTIYKGVTDPGVSAGDIVHLMPGTHYINNQVPLSNVHLEGEGYNSLVVSQITGSTRAISVTNTTGSVLHIRGIRFSGNNTLSPNGILVYNTNNVHIHDCFFENFLRSAVLYNGSTYRTGNRFYNNTVTNCAGGATGGYGDESYAVEVDRQTGFIFQNNTCNETIRSITTCGIPFGGLGGTNGLQILDNNITSNYHQGSYWPFAIELWYQVNTTMTGNIISGEIDFGGFGTTGLYFADNIVGPSSPLSRNTVGLQIEQYCEDVVIERNTFRNVEQAIYFCMAWPTSKVNYADSITIRANVIYGVTGYDSGFGIRFETGSNDELGSEGACAPPTFVNDIKIYANSILSSTTSRGRYGILLPSQGRTSGVTNIDVRDNIISGFSGYAIYAYRQDSDYPQSITTINVTYNNYYGNGNNSTYFNGFTPSNYTSGTGIITTNPNFISSTNLKLQSSSGAIRQGVYISTVTVDRDGFSYLNINPTMGAYEYITNISLPSVTTASVTNITNSSAISGGTITTDGGALVTARGVCWGTSTNPTISGNSTSDGNGTGSFPSTITGLTVNTTYYLRAYAVNAVGIAYGEQRSFYSASGTSSGSNEGFLQIDGILIKDGTQFATYDDSNP